MLVLDEIHVRGVKLIDGHIWVGNFRKINPEEHQSVFKERPKVSLQALLGRPWQQSIQWKVVAVTPHQTVPSQGT